MSLFYRLFIMMFTVSQRKKLELWGTSHKRFHVLPNDLDVLGHMNNGRYLTLMDLARMDLMLRTGVWKRLQKAGWYPVVAGQTISYRRSLNPFQRFHISTKLLGHDEHGVYVEQVFHRGNTVHAKALVRARFLKKSGGTVSTEELDAFLKHDPPAPHAVPEWVSVWAAHNRAFTKNKD